MYQSNSSGILFQSVEVVGTVSQISEPNQWTSLTEISADHNTGPKQPRPG